MLKPNNHFIWQSLLLLQLKRAEVQEEKVKDSSQQEYQSCIQNSARTLCLASIEGHVLHAIETQGCLVAPNNLPPVIAVRSLSIQPQSSERDQQSKTSLFPRILPRLRRHITLWREHDWHSDPRAALCWEYSQPKMRMEP